jgi:hypothetical protein
MAELEATAPEIDEIVAERFSDPRSAIAEHLRTGRNIDEVRFLLRRYFQSFVVRDTDGGRAIVANLRPDVVDDAMADLAGAKREALRGLTQQLAFYMGYCPHRRKGHVSGGTRDSRTLPRRTRLDRHACSSSRTVVWRTLDHTLACRPTRNCRGARQGLPLLSKEQRGCVLSGCSPTGTERPLQDRAAHAVAPEARMRR